MLQRAIDRFLQLLIIFIICSLLTFSSAHPIKIWEFVAPYAGDLAFDVVNWTFDAFWIKAQQTALGTPHYFDRATRKQIVAEYLRVVDNIQQTQEHINRVYSDPNITEPDTASQLLRAKLKELQARQNTLAPLTEAILQDQVSATLNELKLTTFGQPQPPVQYHVTPLPMALIISPRHTIRQDGNFLLLPDLPVEEQEAIETKVAQALDVSTLVVPVGGLGAYPTMVMRTTDINWLVEIIAHEWIHNYLTLRPLGANYMTTPELRTMNETTASIAGNEIGDLIIQRFYPEHAYESISPWPTRVRRTMDDTRPAPNTDFDFRAEMHTTRIKVDELLAEGKIEEAETYMEARRKIFWDAGYHHLRKLNQAYFAFYGAYADVPGGAAGEDPVGPAVRALREQSPTLADFIKRIAQMSSFNELLETINTAQP